MDESSRVPAPTLPRTGLQQNVIASLDMLPAVAPIGKLSVARLAQLALALVLRPLESAAWIHRLVLLVRLTRLGLRSVLLRHQAGAGQQWQHLTPREREQRRGLNSGRCPIDGGPDWGVGWLWWSIGGA